MKVVILEWICGGGMLETEVAEIPPSLREEGWGMVTSLFCLLSSSRFAGGLSLPSSHHITVAHDLRLACSSIPERHRHPISAESQMVDRLFPIPWIELAKAHDVAIVIAPEIDLILPRIARRLRESGAVLWNCQEPFLTRASDKLLTAELLRGSGIAHPATLRLDLLTDAWLREHATLPNFPTARWVVKSRTGAGCEQFSVHQCTTQRRLLTELVEIYGEHGADWEQENFIIQPWVTGKSYSCSSISHGSQTTWMPLMTQEFSVDFKYAGGAMVDDQQHPCPQELLDHTLASLGTGALGWIGIDLVYSDEIRQWYVIEVNPRFTTSVVSLARQPHEHERLVSLLSQLKGQT